MFNVWLKRMHGQKSISIDEHISKTQSSHKQSVHCDRDKCNTTDLFSNFSNRECSRRRTLIMLLHSSFRKTRKIACEARNERRYDEPVVSSDGKSKKRVGIKHASLYLGVNLSHRSIAKALESYADKTRAQFDSSSPTPHHIPDGYRGDESNDNYGNGFDFTFQEIEYIDSDACSRQSHEVNDHDAEDLNKPMNGIVISVAK